MKHIIAIEAWVKVEQEIDSTSCLAFQVWWYSQRYWIGHFDGLVQDCSISSELAKEILQSFIKLSILYSCDYWDYFTDP